MLVESQTQGPGHCSASNLEAATHTKTECLQAFTQEPKSEALYRQSNFYWAKTQT